MEKFIEYLKNKYSPSGIIVYGSYASGLNDSESDFDALLISEKRFHDTSTVFDTRLDVFGYPESCFKGEYDIHEFIQLWNGVIVSDESGVLKKLKSEVDGSINVKKTREENESSLAWCLKMLERAKRGDIEGRYRLLWLLTDSLEIYFDIIGSFYAGPKHALRQLAKDDIKAYNVYSNALDLSDVEAAEKWIGYIKEKFNDVQKD